MTGYLLYDEDGIKRNKWFAQEFIKSAADYGMDLRLMIVDRNDIFYCNEMPGFVIMRVIAPQISRYFEEHNIPVFNNYRTSYYANNKWFTYLLAKKNGIPVMNTYLPTDKAGRAGMKYPFILKSLDGHGGSEVFRVSNEQEYIQISDKLKRNYLLQEVCSDVGKDVRVYCLGKDIVVAILRTSDSDFRSNFSLGGNATLFQPTEAMMQTVELLENELNFSLVGIDFIRHNGEWVLNEIEDVAGTRMIYQCTDINIVDKYIQYIGNRL